MSHQITSPHLLDVIHDSLVTPLDWRLPGEHHVTLGCLSNHNISGFSRDNTHWGGKRKLKLVVGNYFNQVTWCKSLGLVSIWNILTLISKQYYFQYLSLRNIIMFFYKHFFFHATKFSNKQYLIFCQHKQPHKNFAWLKYSLKLETRHFMPAFYVILKTRFGQYRKGSTPSLKGQYEVPSPY